MPDKVSWASGKEEGEEGPLPLIKMYENRRFPLPTGKIPFDIRDYASDVLLGDNSPTVRFGKITHTPGNTPLNTATGGLRELPGRYGVWRGSPFQTGTDINKIGGELY